MAGVVPENSPSIPQEIELPGAKNGFRNWLDRRAWRDIIIVTPYAWLILFFVVPFVIIIAMSLAESVIAQPPFRFGRVINDEFSLNRHWPLASTIAVALLMLLVVPIMLYNKLQERSAEGPK